MAFRSEDSKCYTELSNKRLPIATILQLFSFSQFKDINTATFVVNLIHTSIFKQNLWHDTLSIIILLYDILPRTEIFRVVGQVVVQMRVPEISLGNGLLAQNKYDLCRY